MRVVFLVPRVEHPRLAPFVFGRRRISVALRRTGGDAAEFVRFGDDVAEILHPGIAAGAPVGERPPQRVARRRGGHWRQRRRFRRRLGHAVAEHRLAVLRVRHPGRGRRWWRWQRTPPAITAALERRRRTRRRRRYRRAFIPAIRVGRPHPRHLRRARRTGWRRLRHKCRRARHVLAAIGRFATTGRFRHARLRCGARWVELSRRLSLDLADRLLEREPLARDVGFRQGRRHAAQLGDQRRARALVERTAVLAVVLLQTGDRAGYERVIIGHRVELTRSAFEILPFIARTDSASRSCPRAPGWSTAAPPDSPPVPRSSAHI